MELNFYTVSQLEWAGFGAELHYFTVSQLEWAGFVVELHYYTVSQLEWAGFGVVLQQHQILVYHNDSLGPLFIQTQYGCPHWSGIEVVHPSGVCGKPLKTSDRS